LDFFPKIYWPLNYEWEIIGLDDFFWGNFQLIFGFLFDFPFFAILEFYLFPSLFYLKTKVEIPPDFKCRFPSMALAFCGKWLGIRGVQHWVFIKTRFFKISSCAEHSSRDVKQLLRFPCIQWETEQETRSVSHCI
jgi:hypothetical protein